MSRAAHTDNKMRAVATRTARIGTQERKESPLTVWKTWTLSTLMGPLTAFGSTTCLTSLWRISLRLLDLNDCSTPRTAPACFGSTTHNTTTVPGGKIPSGKCSLGESSTKTSSGVRVLPPALAMAALRFASSLSRIEGCASSSSKSTLEIVAEKFTRFCGCRKRHWGGNGGPHEGSTCAAVLSAHAALAKGVVVRPFRALDGGSSEGTKLSSNSAVLLSTSTLLLR
mmetsp:Transcript_46531/g.129445  ORF Transcript_46531/g.129445 Transcript_46531/m.129445 type:complete len:226 (-) Transcript_46531:322-999(-)